MVSMSTTKKQVLIKHPVIYLFIWNYTVYFCVKTHKEWCLDLCQPLKASSDKASRFLFISPSAEQSWIINNVW